MSKKVNKNFLSIKDGVSVVLVSRSLARVTVNGVVRVVLPNDSITIKPCSDGPFMCVIEFLGDVPSVPCQSGSLYPCYVDALPGFTL